MTKRDLLAQLPPEKRRLLVQRLQERRAGAPATGGGQHSVIADPSNRHEPFPLTDTQEAYWIGRSGVFELGQVAAHCYLEIEGRGLDLERLERAWQRLVERHGMLRVVLMPDGRQRILEEVPPYRIEAADLRVRDPRAAASELEAIRRRMSHQVLPSEQWPLFEVKAAHLADQRLRLFLSLDGLVLDAWSMFILFGEWSELYRDPEHPLPRLDLEFRDYLLAEVGQRDAEAYRESLEYWRRRLVDLPGPPDLPLAKSPAAIVEPRFVRRTWKVEAEDWSRLKAQAAQAGLTPATVLLAAYCEVVSLWSTAPRFTLNVPRFNREPLHPQVDRILGEFASFTLLEADMSGSDPFETRSRRLQERLWEDLDHGRVSGVRVARELAQLRGSPSAGVMPVVFTNAPQLPRGGEVSLLSSTQGLGEVVYSINQTPQVWLDNHVSERGGALICEWDTVEELFPPGLSQNMFDAYGLLVRSLARGDAAWHWRPDEIARRLVPASQIQRRQAVNATTEPMVEGGVHDLFLKQARRRPDSPAVIAPTRTLTYRELDLLSGRWARLLAERGARPNSLVAVVMEKGWEQVVAALAVLRSGAAYLPVDPALPAERLTYLLENGEVTNALTQSWLDATLGWPGHVRRWSVDAEEPAETRAAIDSAAAPDDLAYVIYTSGSTGLPKGVMIGHRGIVNSLVCTNERFEVHPDDRVLGLTALHHDMSVFDIFGTLAAGGALVLPVATGVRDPAHWSELMRDHGVTIWNSVPAMMEMFLEYAEARPAESVATLRLAFLGGDWIPLTVPDRLRAAAPGARLVSVGGPTETTLWNIWYPVEEIDPAWKSVPYGRPIANTRYYVLDGELENRPDGVPGELHCAGVGVARGYWRDEVRTREKFFRHPRTGEWLYRTGDLGRYLPDGNLEFVGRADFQVKIGGQRIEPGEIEAALREHPDVVSAVVVARGGSAKKRLIAYYVAKTTPAPSGETLAAFLAGKLATHMIPTVFVVLPALPLTRNGKIDRSALPEPAEPARQTVPAPARSGGHLVGKIVAIVADVLSTARVEPDANLIALGANSIDMIRIGNALEKQFGTRPRMDQLFRLQTASALAGFYEEQSLPGQTAEAAPGEESGGEVQALVARYRVLLDPAERDRFKDSQPGLRRDLEGPSIPLAQESRDEGFLRRYSERRSYREFSLKPIPAEGFGRFLGCLSQVTLDGKPKYRYASPGGLYPGQIYLHVKPGRIQGVPAGTYYYQPADHRLVSITPNVDIDRTLHIPFINVPIFDQAAFSIFLVAQISAIAPGYGDKSLHFATLEAGIIAHLLESSAPDFEIGLCQIGSLEFGRIRHLFRLEESHVLIHSLLGGRIDPESSPERSNAAETAEAGRATQLLERVRELSPDEVRALLDANRGLDPKKGPR